MTTGFSDKDTAIKKMMEELIQNGTEGFRPAVEELLNKTMLTERSRALGAQPYERTEDRVGYANGFKDKTFQSRLGELHLRIPQTRGIVFYPKSLEKGCRSEIALKLAVAEMYVQGVSTRKVAKITEELCGYELSSTEVSRIAKNLDESLREFRNRPLEEYPFVILDAKYLKIRHAGSVRSLACLVAIGINKDGVREIIGISVSLSEAEVHWKRFMESLQKRGLRGMRLIVSDDHAGLRAARQAVFPSVLWQRCQFHLAQNAQSYASSQPMRLVFGQAVRDIFNACSIDDADRKLKETIDKYGSKYPEFANFLETAVPEGFTIFQFPRHFWKKMRTSNLIENLNLQIQRRVRVCGLFPNSDSALRLVSAVLNEIHEDWQTDKKYLSMDFLNGSEIPVTVRNYRKVVA